MRITNKQTGHSFNLSGKGAADFFYAKNAKGKYINTLENYSIDDKKNAISQIKLSLGSFLLYLNLNY